MGRAFNKFYPNAKIQIEGKGSSTAPPALISGTAQLGPMSREMKGTEVDQFEKKYGYKPTPLRTSVDALAVFVNKDNPIACLTMAQVDGIFSKSRRSGYKEDVKTWGQLGLTGEWASRPISLYGRNSASGTYGFFKEHVLKNGDYKDEVKEQPGSAAVVQGVTVDRFATGYSGIGYATAGVRAVPLAAKDGDKCHEATPDEAYSGKYPLARFLFVYINKAPGKALDPVTREFAKLDHVQGGAGGRGEGRLLPAPGRDHEGRAEQDPVDGHRCRHSHPAGAGGPASSARPLVVSRARTARRIRVDRWTSRLVIVGGLIIIAAILAILVVIAAEVYPLFRCPRRPWSGPTPRRTPARRGGWPGARVWGSTSIGRSPTASTGVACCGC